MFLQLMFEADKVGFFAFGVAVSAHLLVVRSFDRFKFFPDA